MKKILLIIAIITIVWGCSDNNQFTLNGEIIPPSGEKIVLFGFDQGNPSPIDTAEIKEGKFSFTGELNMPELVLLSIEGQQNYAGQIFIEPGEINTQIYPDSMMGNTVTGSEANDIFQIYMDEVIDFSKSEQGLQQRFRQAQTTGNEEEMQNIQFEHSTMLENLQLYAKNFIKEHRETPVAAYVYLMNFFQEADAEELDSMLTMFEPIKESDFVQAIQDRTEKLNASGTGSVAPDFTLTTPEDEEFSLSDYQGNYVLVDFWASWCQPCMIELPNVIDQYKKYNDKGFEIVGVSLDRNRDAWVNTIEEKEMNWVHGWDLADKENQGAVADLYGVTGIPYTVLLDKEGKIIAKNLRG
ncbi:MAG: TlpA disulfide reductase family protein, partial [Prolixibacteraceae bacterium]|nr:TlpA disulfide reductase family protein [Prolixibacteraceae bacterium]